MIVNWKKEKAGINIIPLVVEKDGKKISTGNLMLLPGHNDIPDDKWKMAEDSCKTHIEAGNIEIIGADWDKETKKKKTVKTGDKEKSAESIKDVSPKKAKDIISNTYNIDTLTKWQEEETRDETRLQITKQIDKVKSHGSKKTQEMGI
jgi:hypothetical protein